MSGKKNAFGVLQNDMSLKHLMGNCADFQEEGTMYQMMLKWAMGGMVVDYTLKYPCELARDGVKCVWGCSKNAYCWLPKKRRGVRI